MPELTISGLVIVIGVISTGVGFIVANGRLQSARRVYRKTTGLDVATPGSWGSWFLGGFSGIAMGTQWLCALGAWFIWTLAGLCLIGLGIGLLYRT